MSAFRCNACLQSLSERQYCSVNGGLWQVVPDGLQDDFQFSLACWFGCVLLVLVQHSSPYVIVKRIAPHFKIRDSALCALCAKSIMGGCIN